VNAQLIAAKTDAHLWAKTYERDLKDVFRVQEEIAADVSRALLTSVQGLRPLGAGSRTEQPAAYDAYLRGTYWRQLRTRDGLLRAIQAFEAALAVDSAYAPAYAGLSSALRLVVNYQYSGGPDPVAALARAIVLADRAIAVDPGLAEGFAARGFALMNGAVVSHDSAAQDLARAVALRPNSGEVHAFNSGALSDAGRDEDALAEAQTATDLDPLAPGFRMAFSSVALNARRYDVALREARRAAAAVEAAPVRIRLEGLALLLRGRAGECLALDLRSLSHLKAMCLEARGRHREAAAVVDSLVAAAQASPSSWTAREGLGMYYAWLGDVDTSLHCYETASRVVRPGLLRSGVFDRVRNDARFRMGIERLSERNRARLAQAIAQTRSLRP
jgi:tetratricopeptide (TPR) repeat protein